ncbi:MAG: glycoside hydrolase family 26 protein, partial [Pseudobdellovibrionaceae bacterium]|nr:glycoside hydrolase family 26 protein [Pseudobdellovibrionaceae bacterium]
MKSMRNAITLLSLLAIFSCRPPLDPSSIQFNSGSEDPVQLKNEAYANLSELPKAGRFLFGQQRLNLSGVGREGQMPWGDGSYGTEPDAQQLVGDQPALLGMDVWDFAMKNPTWNQAAYAKAARDFYNNAQGGMITFDWHMRGCDVQDVVDANGNRGIPGDGFKINDWNKDSNRSCLCRIVNEEPWVNGLSWKDWLFTQKLDRFATKLQAEAMDQMPMIFRPFHEMNGSWFWWGAKSWDCEKHLGRKNVISGTEAYKKLFRMSVDYLRNNRGLKNMMIAFSPDKLCKHEGHSCDAAKAQSDTVSDQDLYDDFMSLYPGSSYVDVLGLDLYYSVNNGQPWETPEYQSALFARYLKAVSQIATAEGKVAALTETGNYNLHNEVNKSSDWFSKHLMTLLTGDKDIKLAYALTWENRALNVTEYYIPYVGHAGYSDFRNFAGDSKTMMLKDVGGLYSPNFGQTTPAAGPAPSREIQVPDADNLCRLGDSDKDGDGWGTEAGRACRIATCKSAAADPDGDGWGWESEHTCRIIICQSLASDPDGDGWGWENNRSCQTAVCSSSSTDADGDGWGFENGRSCRVQTAKPAGANASKIYCFDGKSDPDGDGWGWENGRSCEIA